MIGWLLVLTLAAAPSLHWTKDVAQALSTAEDQGRPLLVFFRTNCGGGNKPTDVQIGSSETGPVEHQTGLSDCDLMQEDVWEDAGITSAAARYVPLIVDGGDQALAVRWQVVRVPTTVVADPWGNLILRASGYIKKENMARILGAVPSDFSPLKETGRTLRQDPASPGAQLAAAQFYQKAGLPQAAERLYGDVLAGPGAKDVTMRRQAVIGRGLILLASLNQPAAAATAFEQELAAAPDAAGSDALLLGLVNARLAQGQRKEAETAAKRLEEKYPQSPYTARARQLLQSR